MTEIYFPGVVEVWSRAGVAVGRVERNEAQR